VVGYYFDDCGTCGQVSITGEWVSWSGITLMTVVPVDRCKLQVSGWRGRVLL